MERYKTLKGSLTKIQFVVVVIGLNLTKTSAKYIEQLTGVYMTASAPGALSGKEGTFVLSSLVCVMLMLI